MTTQNIRYKLGRIKCRYVDTLYKLQSGSYDKVSTQQISRDYMFSRVSNADENTPSNPDGYQFLERLILSYPHIVIVNEHDHDDGKRRFYRFDHDDVAKQITGTNKQILKTFKMLDSRAVMVERLKNNPLSSLNDQAFQDGDKLNIVAHDPTTGDEFTCINRDYVNLNNKIYVPIVVNNKLSLRQVKHANILYRATNVTRNSYIGVPAGTWLIIQNTMDDTSQYYGAALVDSDNVICAENSLDALMEKINNNDTLWQNAVTYANIREINFDTADLYVTCCTQ